MALTFLFIGRLRSDFGGIRIRNSFLVLGRPGKDQPVDFPLPVSVTKAYLEEQIKQTEVMFNDILSYSKEFWIYANGMKQVIDR